MLRVAEAALAEPSGTVRKVIYPDRTGPIERWLAGLPNPLPLPSAAQLHEAFLWAEVRTVAVRSRCSVPVAQELSDS